MFGCDKIININDRQTVCRHSVAQEVWQAAKIWHIGMCIYISSEAQILADNWCVVGAFELLIRITGRGWVVHIHMRKRHTGEIPERYGAFLPLHTQIHTLTLVSPPFHFQHHLVADLTFTMSDSHLGVLSPSNS